MKDFFLGLVPETIKNIAKIEDLRTRIMYTLGLILIFRIGSYVVLPGIDPNAFEAAMSNAGGGLAGLLDLFAGGGFNRASVFALGIMPYISASIAVQLLTFAVPYFQKLQKEGESGRRQINEITRYLTVIVTIVQGFAYYGYLSGMEGGGVGPRNDFIVINNGLFLMSTIIILTSGTLFCMWLGERITENGIGNGISLLIMIGIIASLPGALVREFLSREQDGAILMFFIELAFLIAVVFATVALVQGVRRVPVQYAKRIVGARQYGGHRQYLPLKVNAAGVMPIIFAQALMFIPGFLQQAVGGSSTVLATLNDYTSIPYNIIYFFLVVIFTYFYTAITVNPVQMADDLKRNGGFIPGVKPGRKTAEYLDTILSRVTLPGSIALGLVAILPAFAASFGVSQGFALFFGGTSLLIMVGVVLDTLQQVESHLLMRHYDGLMKSGRIKGRASGVSSGM